jgi:hypothetical protein
LNIYCSFTRIYSARLNWRPKLDSLTFNTVDAEEASWLERAFEESEVFEVVKALNGDEAPSLDGFLFGFLLALLGGS